MRAPRDCAAQSERRRLRRGQPRHDRAPLVLAELRPSGDLAQRPIATKADCAGRIETANSDAWGDDFIHVNDVITKRRSSKEQDRARRPLTERMLAARLDALSVQERARQPADRLVAAVSTYVLKNINAFSAFAEIDQR